MKLSELLNESFQDVTFTKSELVKIFKHFLDRLVKDHGNTREDMIKYHVDKLVGLPYRQVVQKMPRGPKGRWADLMMDIKAELRTLAMERAAEGKARSGQEDETK